MSANPPSHDIPNGVGLRGQKYKKNTIINTIILFNCEIKVFVTIYIQKLHIAKIACTFTAIPPLKNPPFSAI